MILPPIRSNFRDIFDNDIFDSFYKLTPATNVDEDNDNFIITMELPGMSKADINVSMEDNILSISGEKKVIRKDSTHITERRYGKFSRSFSLPNTVKEDQITASFNDGILEVKVPKQEHQKKKLITVD